MCGIAGIWNTTSDRRIEATELRRMVDTMLHRGPDAQGVKTFEGGGFGHARLSILDLSPESDQPFESEDGALLLTYNGEIFNYLELRAELEGLGHRFRTRSDTEVVLHAYQEWGHDAPRRFNGMWAFAIYDEGRDELFCSRDRFGIKPFYYAPYEGQLLFASEVKAILAARRALATPSYPSLSRFLRAGIGAQLEQTFFEGIFRLPPAHSFVVSRSGIQRHRYWSFPTDVLDLTAEQAAERLRELLLDSVRLRMRSDVPVGSTLSGGVDSSAIVGLLRTFNQDPFETFTASYPGHPYDETERAQRLCDALGLNPNPIPATTDEFLGTLRQIVWHMDSPVLGPGTLPLWNIMRAMRGKVVVALEGQGADEIFAGYEPMNLPFLLADRLREGRPDRALHELVRHRQLWGLKSSTLWCARALLPDAHRLFRRLRGDEQVYAGPLRGLADKAPSGAAPPRFADSLTGMLHRQATGVLAGLLHQGDAVSMAHSMESRLPFMDYRVVELGFRLRGSLKARAGYSKSVLRDAIRDDVPPFVTERRRKLGFGTPVARWFREDARRVVDPVLLDERCRSRGLFDRQHLERSLRRHRLGQVDISSNIFRWISTELWFQSFIDGAGVG